MVDTQAPAKKRWTREDRETLIQKWRTTPSLIALSIELGRSPNSIQTQASRLALPSRQTLSDTRRVWTAEEREKLAFLRSSRQLPDGRVNILDVAKELGRTIDAVARYMGLLEMSAEKILEYIYLPDAYLTGEQSHAELFGINENWQSESLDELLDDKRPPKDRSGMRDCRSCGKPFFSEGIFNQICKTCKDRYT